MYSFSLAAITALIICLLYLGVPWLHKELAVWRLSKKARARRSLCLTFDDGPGAKLTTKVAETIALGGGKASFFLLGMNISGKEQIVRMISKQGHQICSHGYEHLHYWRTWPWRTVQDIRLGWKAIDGALGVTQGKYPFRPPYGKLNCIALLYLLIKKVPIVYWTFDAGDTWELLPDERSTIERMTSLTPGAVVLIHDFDRQSDRPDEYVMAVVAEAMRLANEYGLRMETVGELLRG